MQPTLISKSKRSLFPVVQQRQSIADGLAKYMSMLGLQRRSKPVSLDAYIERKYGNRKDDHSETEQGENEDHIHEESG